MKRRILSTARLSFPLASALAALVNLAAPSASAATYYWDSNASTTGFGNTTGTWGTNAFWTTVNTGGATHSAVTATLAADIVNFGTATVNYGNATVGVAAGGVTATSIVFGAGQTTALTIGTAGGGAITLGGSTRTIVMNTSSTNTAAHTIDAPIILTGATKVQIGPIGAAATRTLTLGAMSGTGGVTFEYTGTNNGTGVILLNGASTYTGTTLISTSVTNGNTELRLGVDDALPTTTVLTIGGVAGTGTAPGRRTQLNLNGNDQTLAGLATTGGGSLRTQNILSSTAATLTIDGTTSNAFAGLIGNGGTNISIVKAGSGTQTFSGANTYIGTTTIDGGTITVSSATALGSTAAGTVVNGTTTNGAANARLALTGGVTVTGEALTINGSGNFSGALTSLSGNNIWAGPVTIGSSGTRLGASAGSSLEVSGVIDSGVATTGLIIRTFAITGSVILSGANTYLGETQISNGKLQLAGGDNRLPVATKLTMGSPGGANPDAEFDLNGRNQEVAGLSLTGTAVAANNSLNNSSLTLSTLTVNTASASTFAGILKGNLALTKSGSNTLTLSGGNTHTGDTSVTAGTLALSHNDAAGTGDVLVSGASASTLQIDAGITLAGNNITFSNTNASSNVKRGVADGGAYTIGTTGTLTGSFASVTPDTSAKILDGTNSVDSTPATLTMSFSGTAPTANNDGARRSDVFTLTGTGSDAYVLELFAGALGADSQLGWLNGSNDWVNAGTGTFVSGVYDSVLTVGRYGYDSTTNVAWAVVDHGGSFSVIPEPTSALAGLLIGAGLLRRRRSA